MLFSLTFAFTLMKLFQILRSDLIKTDVLSLLLSAITLLFTSSSKYVFQFLIKFTSFVLFYMKNAAKSNYSKAVYKKCRLTGTNYILTMSHYFLVFDCLMYIIISYIYHSFKICFVDYSYYL